MAPGWSHFLDRGTAVQNCLATQFVRSKKLCHLRPRTKARASERQRASKRARARQPERERERERERARERARERESVRVRERDRNSESKKARAREKGSESNSTRATARRPEREPQSRGCLWFHQFCAVPCGGPKWRVHFSDRKLRAKKRHEKTTPTVMF